MNRTFILIDFKWLFKRLLIKIDIYNILNRFIIVPIYKDILYNEDKTAKFVAHIQ